MKLSKLQTEIIEDSTPRAVVMAAAASGKTRTLTEKARTLLRQGVDPRTMAIITFTNMAAAELRKRLDTDYRDGMFIGTIHSLANQMLVTHGIDTSKLINDEDFDKLFSLLEVHPECVRHYQWVLLDEAQDSGEEEFQFVLGLIDPENFWFFGDVRQSIYGFKGARPDLLLGIMRRQDVKVFDMNENYRNGYNILEFARRIIRPNGLSDSSIAMRFGENGIVKELTFSFHTIVELIQKEPSYKDWAVLVRTNNELSDIATVLKKANIPYDTFRQGDLKLGELEERMAQNKVKVLTIHSAKGLEWNNVIVVGARFWNDEERNVCYVAATRARNQLYWMTEQKKQYKKMNRW